MTNPEVNSHTDKDDAGAAQAAANGEPAAEHQTTANNDHGAEHHAAADSGHGTEHDQTNETMSIAATVGVVAVGAALFEVALLPGIALGVAAMLAPKYVPKLGAAVTPIFRSSVRGVYKFGQKTREVVAEAKEQVNDIVAEVHAEKEPPKAAAASAGTPRA
jgi:hypothetical protein